MIGKIISLSSVIGPVFQFMTTGMYIYASLNAWEFWWQFLPISKQARNALQLWLNQSNNLNVHGMWHTPSVVRVDTSNTSYAGYTREHDCHIFTVFLESTNCKSFLANWNKQNHSTSNDLHYRYSRYIATKDVAKIDS